MDHLPEQIREQLEAQKEQCIFCKILKGEIPSKKVYEDGVLTGLLDINPAIKGHMLVMPNEHYPILPLISPEEFDRLFGLMPQFASAVREAMISDGVTIFVANGGVAGQQSPHFLVHLIPRERGDGLSQFDFVKRAVDAQQLEQVEGQVRQVLSMMLAKHIGFEPIEGDAFLQSRELVIARSAKEQVAGHLEIRFADDRTVSAMSAQDSAKAFRAASLASTALFENLGAEGTNIIADTREGFVIHVMPRRSDDGVELLWQPMRQPPNQDEVGSSLSKELFKVQVRVEKGEFDLPDLETSGLEELASETASDAHTAQEPAEQPAARAPSAPPSAPPRSVQPQEPASPARPSHPPSNDPIRARINAAWERLRK